MTFVSTAAKGSSIDVTKLAGYVLDDATVTSNQASTATSAATATTLIAGHSITLDGLTTVEVSVWAIGWQTTITTSSCIIELYDGSTDLGQMWAGRNASSATGTQPSLIGRYRFTPTAGAHQFIAKGWIGSAGTFTLVAGAAGAGLSVPAELRVAI
jgi:hypothetical protein